MEDQLTSINSVLAAVVTLVTAMVAFNIVVRVIRWIDTGDSNAPSGAAYWWEDSKGNREYFDKRGNRL